MGNFGIATIKKDGQILPSIVLEDKTIISFEKAIAAGVAGIDRAWAESNGISNILNAWFQVDQQLKKVANDIEKLVAKGVLSNEATNSKILPPYVPQKIYCAASNYAEHADEMGTELAAKENSKPFMFLKLANTVVGDGDTVQMPPETKMLDWEIELAAVIGKRGRRISVEEALSYVAGYTVINDVSARDLNMRDDYPFKFDWFQGKCHDTFSPIGPWIVPASQIPDPQKVTMTLSVNGEMMQNDTADNMIWKVAEQIAYLSTIVTLEPGDMIATGTPTGVGMGKGIYLKDGDQMVAGIKEIGSISNVVKAEVI